MGAFDEVVVTNGQLERGQIESQVISSHPGMTSCEKETLLIICGDVGCLNYRYSTASLTEGDSLLHLFKLECQGPLREGLDCNHGCYKAANQSCHVELDNSDMFMLNIGFPIPGKFRL